MSIQSLYNQYITADFIKDLKFWILCFIGMCFLLFHYAWVVKQWLHNPYQPTYEIVAKFAGFFLVAGGTTYLLFGKVYYIIYDEAIDVEKKEE